MISFFAVVDKLLAFLQMLVTAKEQTKIQEARDQIENNPSDWFEHHFNGMPADKSNKDEAK